MLARPTRTAVYGPVRTVVWQGSAGDRRPYADLVGNWEVNFWFARHSPREMDRATIRAPERWCMGLSTGTRLGPYEILSLVGAGGMGEVYRARDARLERTVAIKVLNSHLVASRELRARFEREAKIISQLQHPHICVLHDVGRENGTEFLVMEFLEGESLADIEKGLADGGRPAAVGNPACRCLGKSASRRGNTPRPQAR